MAKLLSILAIFLGLLTIGSVGPLIVAQFAGEETILSFLLTLMVTGFVAFGLGQSLKGATGRMRRVEALCLVAASFVVMPAFAALPFVFSGQSRYLVAYLDMVSALTTTGVLFGEAMARWPTSLVLWHAIIQWFGGALSILFLVIVLGPLSIGGLPIRHVRVVEHGGEDEAERLVETFAELGPIYVGATALCFLGLVVSGLPALDALCVALAILSTGGAIAREGGFATYGAPIAEIVATVFMLVAATSVVWIRLVLQGRVRQALEQPEVAALALLVVALGLLIAANLAADGRAPLEALRHGLFTAVSLISTTGLSISLSDHQSLPAVLTIVVVFVGGATFSAAGGLKLHRVGTALIQATRELNRALYPSGIGASTIGGQYFSLGLMKAIWVAVLLHVLVFTGLMIALAPAAGDFEAAYRAAAGLLSGIGQIHSDGPRSLGAWVPFSAWPDYAKVIACVGMILGRMETLAGLALIHLALWRR